MFSNSLLKAVLVLPVLLRSTVLAQTSTTTSASSSSTACNNSPLLCDRQYNHITHLGAHDSPFLNPDNTESSGNQMYNTTVQLAAGVRLVTAQVHYVSQTSTWNLCHSSCDLLNAGTLSDWLGEIKSWLDDNPNEVVTVLLVNSDNASAQDLANQYETAGITDYTYTPSSAAATTQWPTLQSLINSGTRLLTFVPGLTNSSTASVAPYLMDEWTYIFETPYVNYDPSNFTCTADRPSGHTAASAIADGMLPFMNHFMYSIENTLFDTPNVTYTPVINAPGNVTGNLGLAARTCESQWGRRPAFVLVDYFNVGPAIETIDELNGVTNAVGRMSVSTLDPAQVSNNGVSVLASGLSRVGMIMAIILAMYITV